MINAVFAVDFNGGMGINGTLPWPHNAEDMAHFQQLTENNIVVMGRRTWDDPKMPKPLKNRTVYVATNRPVAYANPISGNISDKLLHIEANNPDKKIFVIGGVQLLESVKPLLEKVYITHIKGSYRADTRIYVKEFVTGFQAIQAQVSKDCQSTFIIYESIFKRTQTGS